MPRIDDPLEAVDKEYEDKRDPIAKTILEIATELEPFGILKVLKIIFSKEATTTRFEALIKQLILEVRRLDNAGRLLRDRLESDEVKETVIAALNESARTIDLEKIKRFAAIVGSSFDSKRTNKSWDDPATYIRDLAQLGDRDIQALQILYSIQKDLFLGKHLALDPNSYTKKNDEVLKLVDDSGMPRDEFYSRCSRLNGFGLAIEVQRNEGRVSPSDHCFRITTRGRELVSIISG